MTTRVFPNGTVCHYDEQGRRHCDGAPAAHNLDGSEVWAQHGKIHRVDGPAVRLVFADGYIEEQWWCCGIQDTTGVPMLT